MQVRQVPLRHELAKVMPAAAADSSNVRSACAAKLRPEGCSTARYVAGAAPSTVIG